MAEAWLFLRPLLLDMSNDAEGLGPAAKWAVLPREDLGCAQNFPTARAAVGEHEATLPTTHRSFNSLSKAELEYILQTHQA